MTFRHGKKKLSQKLTTPKAGPDNLNPVTSLTQDQQTPSHTLDSLKAKTMGNAMLCTSGEIPL